MLLTTPPDVGVVKMEADWTRGLPGVEVEVGLVQAQEPRLVPEEGSEEGPQLEGG